MPKGVSGETMLRRVKILAERIFEGQDFKKFGEWIGEEGETLYHIQWYDYAGHYYRKISKQQAKKIINKNPSSWEVIYPKPLTE